MFAHDYITNILDRCLWSQKFIYGPNGQWFHVLQSHIFHQPSYIREISCLRISKYGLSIKWTMFKKVIYI